MEDRRTAMMLHNLSSRKQALQDQITDRREEIAGLEEEIGRFNEQVQKLDADIDKVNAKADLEAEKEIESMEDDQTGLGTEEADAATTTAALDASSSGGAGGGSGWRHYGKVGPTITRFSGKRKKKKTKRDRILSYVNKVFDPDKDGDGDVDAGDFS